MHCQCEVRKVTSICQRRPLSEGSSNDTHSRTGPVEAFCFATHRAYTDRRYPSIIEDVRALVSDLQAALGTDRARAEPLELALYQRDAGVDRGRAAAVCFPSTG